jgi:thiamine-phosphate pyrophosphorylase
LNARPQVSFKLYLITDRRVVKNGDLISACEEALSAAAEVAPAGTVALQLREKDLDARELYELTLRLREICTRNGALLLVNDRIDVAIAADADGVQLPFDSVGASMARKLLGPNRLIGSSSHSPPDVSGAAREGADFAVFAPVFDPISKSPTTHAWGVEGLAAACHAGAVPVYALGGITPERAHALMTNPHRDDRPAGVAAIGSIFGADSPAHAIKEMLAALDVSRPAR